MLITQNLCSKGGKFVACVLSPPEKLPDGITTNFMNALTILHNDISQLVWGDYVPKALEQGKLQAKPDPRKCSYPRFVR